MRDRIAIVDINTKKFKAISYKQYDENNILQIVVLENGKIKGISNYAISVRFQLPSGKIYRIPGVIENDTIKVILTRAILDEYGKVIVEVELTNEKLTVTTFSIYLNVEKSINKEACVDPDNDPTGQNQCHLHENKVVIDQITQEMIDTILSIEEFVSLNFQEKEDEKLETEDKTIVGAINEVNEKIVNIDLSDYATKEEVNDVNEKIENIDLSDYATKEEVNEAIENVDVTEQLKDLATKEEVNKTNMQVDKNSNDINTILGIIDEPPIYINPTLSISSSSSNIEHNIQTKITLTPKFTQNDAGNVISYSLKKDNNEIYSNTVVGAYTDNITLQHNTSVTYSAVVHYGDGVIKNTLLGIEYPETSIKEGNISNNVIIRGYAPSYYGIINEDDIDDVDGLTKVLRTSKSSTLTFNMINQRVVYIYPKSFGDLTSIKDANNFDYINSYTLKNMTLNNVEYNVYILTDAVTINGFKQIFN